MMSVNPPFEVGCAVGEYRTRPFNQAIRIVAQLLGDAAVAVAKKFTPAEWAVIAASYEDRTIEPENSQPGYALARLVGRAHHRYQTGAPLGKNPDKATGELIQKLEALDYLESWAVIVACQFRDYYQDLNDGDPWWSLAFRKEKIAERLAAEK
jgi:hypothetical protein